MLWQGWDLMTGLTEQVKGSYYSGVISVSWPLGGSRCLPCTYQKRCIGTQVALVEPGDPL